MKNLISMIAAAALIAALSGCFLSDDSPTSPATVPEPGIDLDSPTGGFTTSDEAPAFGEPEAFEAFNADAPVLDPIENTYEYQTQLQAEGALVFELRAVWGNLFAIDDSTRAESCPLDWSGSLRLEGGRVVGAIRNASDVVLETPAVVLGTGVVVLGVAMVARGAARHARTDIRPVPVAFPAAVLETSS